MLASTPRWKVTVQSLSEHRVDVPSPPQPASGTMVRAPAEQSGHAVAWSWPHLSEPINA